MNGTGVFLLIGSIVIGRFFLLPTALMGFIASEFWCEHNNLSKTIP